MSRLLIHLVLLLTQDILSQVNPRKPNWDLKRDVQRKMNQLSRQTDSSILQLIKKKLTDNATKDVAAATAIATSTLDDEDAVNAALRESDSDDDEK